MLNIRFTKPVDRIEYVKFGDMVYIYRITEFMCPCCDTTEVAPPKRELLKTLTIEEFNKRFISLDDL